MRLPGEKEARELGYTCYSSAGDYSEATYTKELIGVKSISLSICSNKNGKLFAKLYFIYKILIIETSDFSWPNSNFDIFEKQIIEAFYKLNSI